MPSSQGQISDPKTSVLPKAMLTAIPAPITIPTSNSLTWRPASLREAVAQPTPPPPARCSEKGCVFPASPGTGGKCLHHLRQSQEPILFLSYQPTRAVLDRGVFEIPTEETDTSRNQDRRKLAAIREAFLED